MARARAASQRWARAMIFPGREAARPKWAPPARATQPPAGAREGRDRRRTGRGASRMGSSSDGARSRRVTETPRPAARCAARVTHGLPSRQLLPPLTAGAPPRRRAARHPSFAAVARQTPTSAALSINHARQRLWPAPIPPAWPPACLSYVLAHSAAGAASDFLSDSSCGVVLQQPTTSLSRPRGAAAGHRGGRSRDAISRRERTAVPREHASSRERLSHHRLHLPRRRSRTNDDPRTARRVPARRSPRGGDHQRPVGRVA